MQTKTDSSLKLCFVPKLLPDELLSSYLARLGLLNGLGRTSYYRDFCGTKSGLPVLDLPTNLALLQERLSCSSPFGSIDALVEHATLFPYHRPFLAMGRAKLAEEIIRHRAGHGLKALLGRLANRFGANPELRYCPECICSDTISHGSSYWHRSHQLPGVTACFEHKLGLVTPAIPLEVRRRTKPLLPPIQQAEPGLASTGLQAYFAKLSAELLHAQRAAAPEKERVSLYRAEVIAKGLVRNGRIDYRDLQAALRAHYCDFACFVHRDRLLASARTPLAWVRPLIERHQRSSHPICHLLLIGFLFGTLENFFKRFEAGARTHDESASTRERPCKMPISMLLDSTKSCRAVAKALDLSVTTVALRRRAAGISISERYKRLTPGLIAQIIIHIRQGKTPTEIAEECSVSLSTVYRQRKLHADEAKEFVTRSLDQLKERHREDWLKAVSSHRYLGPKAVRQQVPAVYAWLYRNDRDWLLNSCAELHIRRPVRQTVDWPKRDAQMADKLLTYAARMRETPERPRISRTLLANHLGEASVRVNLPRLPKVSALLDALEEPPLSYQIYKIDRAIEKLLGEGRPLAIWKIRRAAGMRKWTPMHEAYARWMLKTHPAGSSNLIHVTCPLRTYTPS